MSPGFLQMLALVLCLTLTPTAQAPAGEVALTLNRGPTMELGLGLTTRDQAVPFQCKISARGCGAVPHAEVQYCPTAQALVAEAALTLRSSELAVGLGLATRDQAMPFQCKISVCSRAGEV